MPPPRQLNAYDLEREVSVCGSHFRAAVACDDVVSVSNATPVLAMRNGRRVDIDDNITTSHAISKAKCAFV